MLKQINLLRSLPKSQRNIHSRTETRSPTVIGIAREYGAEYFDGDRKYGYGGYKDDGRWGAVADDIIREYGLHNGLPVARVLDVGCAKGFLVKELCARGIDAFGLDISTYALHNCSPNMVGRLHQGSAEKLPFPDNSFDLVVSINTLHNLSERWVVRALNEIMRVSRDAAFVQVDAYHNDEQKARFEAWVLTAYTHGTPEYWKKLFSEANYVGDYDWTVV